MDRERILLGQIGQAHGLKGEVKLTSFTEDPAAIARYGPLEMDQRNRLTIASVKPAKGGLIVKFEGINDRTAAERLRGAKLYVPRERLPPPEEGSYYQADLIGLEVKAAEKVVGKVVAIANFGAGDLLEVRGEQAAETMLVPFTGAKVDLGRGVIEVELAEEFLEKL